MSGTASRDWDATTYDRISTPQQSWAGPLLDRLALAGDEFVLDAGCGSGRITLELVRRLPSGTVYAVDAAPSMVAHTQRALGDRATVLCQDLSQLALPEAVDVIFSNATFHWLPDHDALFAALGFEPPQTPRWRARRSVPTSTAGRRRGRTRRRRRLRNG